MRRGKAISILAALLLILVLVGAFVTQWEALAASWRHRTVRKLLDPTQREAVYKQIVGWQRYRGVPRYTVDPLRPGQGIHDVILSPQRDGRPFYIVVFTEFGTDGSRRHFELVDFDGTLVPAFRGANMDACDFKDLNQDGVLDQLFSMVVEFEGAKDIVEELTLVPMTPEQKPALGVIYRKHFGDARWTWTVFESSAGLPEIRLGPRDAITNELTPLVTYRWDPSRSDYSGPRGGIDQEFLRVDDDTEKRWEFVLYGR